TPCFTAKRARLWSGSLRATSWSFGRRADADVGYWQLTRRSGMPCAYRRKRTLRRAKQPGGTENERRKGKVAFGTIRDAHTVRLRQLQRALVWRAQRSSTMDVR